MSTKVDLIAEKLVELMDEERERAAAMSNDDVGSKSRAYRDGQARAIARLLAHFIRVDGQTVTPTGPSPLMDLQKLILPGGTLRYDPLGKEEP